MALNSDQKAFVDRWLEKVKLYDLTKDCLEDHFDHFFSSWVLYNFLYNKVCSSGGDRMKATDQVIHFLSADKIWEDREITKQAKDLCFKVATKEFYLTSSCWGEYENQLVASLRAGDAEVAVKSLLGAIYDVRCNTFHGDKEFMPNQKRILLPCILIIEQLNGMLFDKLWD